MKYFFIALSFLCGLFLGVILAGFYINACSGASDFSEVGAQPRLSAPSVDYVDFLGEEISVGEFEKLAIEEAKEKYGVAY